MQDLSGRKVHHIRNIQRIAMLRDMPPNIGEMTMEIPDEEVLCKIYIDEYCYLEGPCMCRECQPGFWIYRGIDEPKLKYRDYWEWFWESNP
jgi:hypothetical protein